MNYPLFWKLCLVIATGIVAFFYAISILTSRTEEGMSFIEIEHREQLIEWGAEAEQLYLSGNQSALDQWLTNIQTEEGIWIAVASHQIVHIAGNKLTDRQYEGHNLGRSVNWKIHLYFKENPVMELPFRGHDASLLVKLPDRMRPGAHWEFTHIFMQIILPLILLALLSFVLYRHIMTPLRQLQLATKNFSQGNFNVRVRQLLGKRNDELSELANTFDQMATRIGELIIGQRQLIADLSHELRTPLTRLDIAVEGLHGKEVNTECLQRVRRESGLIRKLVDDTLTFAWLENERPELQDESVNLVDLLDILIEDAKFEFPAKHIEAHIPDTAEIKNSSHRALGQALENILRNAMRYTPNQQEVSVKLESVDEHYRIEISDHGPGVPEDLLMTIFQPFFRVDTSRSAHNDSFGLGLALAQRQLMSVGARVKASNRACGGLTMTVLIPIN